MNRVGYQTEKHMKTIMGFCKEIFVVEESTSNISVNIHDFLLYNMYVYPACKDCRLPMIHMTVDTYRVLHPPEDNE